MFVVFLDRPYYQTTASHLSTVGNELESICCGRAMLLDVLFRLPNKYGFGFKVNIDSLHTFVWSNLADLARRGQENKIATKKTATREEWMERQDKNVLSWPENRSDANTFDLFTSLWLSLDVYGARKQNGLIKLDYHLSVADYSEGGSGAPNETAMALMHVLTMQWIDIGRHTFGY